MSRTPASAGSPRRRISVLLVCALALPVLARAQIESTVRPVTVGVLTENYPFSFTDGSGAPQGYAVDLLAAIERTMGLSLRRVVGGTAEINGAFQQGRLEMLQSYAQFPEREALADFSVPYLTMAGSIFVRRGLDHVRTLEDLRGRKVLVHAGSLGEQVLKSAGLSASIVHVASVDGAFLMLERGKGDATLAGRLTGLMAVYRHDLRNVTAVGEPVPHYQVRYCFAVRDGDRRLLAQLNEGMAIIERTGVANEIYQRWFGPVEPTRYSALQIALAVASGLAIALVVAIWGMLRQRGLRQRLVRQSERLQRHEQQLRQSQKLEAVGTLTSGIAHDFNNILTSIIGNAELVRMDLPADHPGAASNDEVLRAAERARLLVRQILSFSRHADPRRGVIEAAPIVDETLGFLRAAAPASLEIAHTRDGDTHIEADATQVHQVLMNLGANAIHAMRGRPGRLEVSEERVRIEPEVAAEDPQVPAGDYLRIAVRDTGCGIPADVLPRIFEPFFTTKAPGEGSGLGLAVVHGILQSHGGAVTVDSRPAEGTIVRLYFPIASRAATREPTPDARAHVQGRGEHILFIDDEEPITRSTELLLKRLGYVVSTHCEADTALAQFSAERDRFAVVFMDLTMPRLSGLDVAERVRSIRPDVPIVLASGFLGEADLARARTLRVTHLVDKPLTLNGLASALAACLTQP
jgi:signal transduction histidine kinase/ActR/RegA family two-component response regulator